MRVLIIGAGIGGLCLAHGLRRVGIDVCLFERNSSLEVDMAGYGIHLDRHGCDALHECLPSDSWARFDAIAGHAGGGMRFYDEQLKLLAEWDGTDVDNHTDGQNTGRRSIGRLELREILIHGLNNGGEGKESSLRWGKEFVGYERTADGRVHAHFADGSQDFGDLLIGADASHSRVRQQYLPEIRRFDVGVTVIAGRYPLSRESITAFPAMLTDGTPNNIAPVASGWMFVSAWRSRHDVPSSISGVAENGYAVWAYVVPQQSCLPDVIRLASEELRNLVLSRIDGWAPALRTLVRDCDVSTVSPVVLRSMPNLRQWNPSTVTLLGDAIHNMTPMAGVGANTALRDADVLRQELSDVSVGGHSLVEAVGGYEKQMREYANEAVRRSLRNSLNAASDSRLRRKIFRAVLRLAQAVPTFKHMMFSGSDV